jgi:spore maturation protein A
MPEIWQQIAQDKSGDSPETLMATVGQVPSRISQSKSTVSVVLPQVRFVKLRAITTAAFDMAEFAVKLAIGLIGAMALWLGLMRIAEQSGLIRVFNKMVQPVLKYLFPSIPKDHPAYSAISLNLAANVLGLGNAATPLGIKAMEELQKLNDDSETASDAMCMFLAINTSSVQLLPPVTLVALMGVAVNELMISIIIATTVSTITGILGAKWMARRSARKQLAN